MNVQWHSLITAFQFLTRIPLPGGMNRPDPDMRLLRSAVKFFPIVGAFVTAMTAMVIWLTAHVWPIAIAVILGLIFEAILTGGFHEDAVADCCDAFGGGWSTEDVLRILKDSRVGSFGALGLMLAVGLRFLAISHLPWPVMMVMVVASGAIGRWAILVLMMLVPPITQRESLSKDVGEQIGWGDLLIGTLVMIPFVIGFAWHRPLACLVTFVVCVVAMILWGRYVKYRIGGICGDALGAGCYLAQIVVLLAGLTVLQF